VHDDEVYRLVDLTAETVKGRIPVYFGASSYDTAKLVKQAKALERRGVKGILSSTPYYNRPDQRGIFEHFRSVAESTSMDIILYNIPYRTGRNIENDTIRRLAEIKNIIGLKDSCGDIKQTSELLLDPPHDFSILTGEDALFFTTLALGGSGGILAAAHVETEKFLRVYEFMKENQHHEAREAWKTLAEIILLLFIEPNPAPIKYLLEKCGLIESSELRLPLVGITEDLKAKLDVVLKK
jgi:4-hydroxy-tetrahydrodipicolinate synthase